MNCQDVCTCGVYNVLQSCDLKHSRLYFFSVKVCVKEYRLIKILINIHIQLTFSEINHRYSA